MFERNGTAGAAIFRHPHFLPYLRYFIFGPALPASAIEEFGSRVAAMAPITSGDLEPLRRFARDLTRRHGLPPRETAEEFFKLAMELDLSDSFGESIRGAVLQVRH